jgi:phosphoglycolate phosphatase-like HAD superfamily hydrolase
MNLAIRSLRAICAGIAIVLAAVSAAAQRDPLPSWRDTGPKKAIITFVQRVTTAGGPEFVPANERIATFDNDGTLWVEQPMYPQFAFALDRIKALAPQHPEWKNEQPFEAVLENDQESLAASGEAGIAKIVAASHARMTTDEFATIVNRWIATAKHPRFKRPYIECVYQPMLELLAYLRANGFKTYIVSGGGVDFMRPWAEKVYGIPPEQVIGSSVKEKFELRDGKPILLRLPEIDFIDDGPGKPVGIDQHIGRKPIAAFGNSDGDQQMLEWTADNKTSLVLIVHHTDAEREYAYDRTSRVGKLGKAWDEATARGWIVVDMKNDWKAIFPGNEPASNPSTTDKR